MIEFLRSSKAHLFVGELIETVFISGENHHHLARVKRLAARDRVTCAENGFVREYKIVEITRDSIHLVASGEKIEIDEPEINIVVSLFKLDRLEWGISKAVEAGATSITVAISDRSSLKIENSKLDKIARRCEAISLSAVMQSRRAQLVPISFVGNLLEYCMKLESTLVICEPDGSSDIPSTPATIVIGPEGGFSPEELSAFENISRSWSISPYILRAETAMAVVPALLNISNSDAK